MPLNPNFWKLLLIFAVGASLLFTGFAVPQQDKPITKEQLTNALKQLRPADSQTAIVNRVRSRGVDFELTSAIEADLRSAGARPLLISTVRQNFRRQNASVSTPSPLPTGESWSEHLAWAKIKNSNVPEDFYSFLKAFPKSTRADNARSRLSDLSHIKAAAGIEMVWIAPGNFMMGSTNGFADEERVHQVTINYSFYMGKYEITQAQWQSVMPINPSSFEGENLPVENVSWVEVQEFIRKLNAQNDGYHYRLPTEAEREYVSRAGTTTNYYWGDDVNEACRYANVSDQTAKDKYFRQGTVKCRDGYADISPVGRFQPNAWGLYDVTGNVREWCEDWYHPNYDGAPIDGSAWLTGGEQKYRVLRGGLFVGNAIYLRSACRNKDTPDNHDALNGFRVVAVR